MLDLIVAGLIAGALIVGFAAGYAWRDGKRARVMRARGYKSDGNGGWA